jgi:hypothetical protein
LAKLVILLSTKYSIINQLIIKIIKLFFNFNAYDSAH